MPKIKFKSKKDLQKFFEKKLNKEVRIDGLTFDEMLKREAEKLRTFIKKYINEHYRNYQPTIYRRTYDLINSLKIEPVKTKGQSKSIKIYFDETAYKPSVVYNKQRGKMHEEGFTPILMDIGWHWSKPHKVVPYFTDFEGIHFIEKAVEAYSKSGVHGIKIKVIKEYTGEKGHWIDTRTWYI